MSITAAQLLADMQSIRTGFPAAVVTVTIDGNDYEAVRGSGQQDASMEDIGAIRGNSFPVMLMQSELDANAQTITPLSTRATISSTTYIVTSAQPDPTAVFLIVTLDAFSHFEAR